MTVFRFLIAISLLLVGCATTEPNKQGASFNKLPPTPRQPAATPVNQSEISYDKQGYFMAYDELRSGHTLQSIEQFKVYLNEYPTGEYANNAQYWLGEAYRVNQDNASARKAFNDVLEKYPNSAKVPDAILKLGYIEVDFKNLAKAREYLSLVISDYSASPAAVLASKKLLQSGLTEIQKADNTLNLPPKQIPKDLVKIEKETLIKSTSVNLEEFKAECQVLGFKVGTTAFGNCVLELNEAK